MKRSILPTAPPGRPRKYTLRGGRRVGPDYAPTGDWQPLTKNQKARLCQLAREGAALQFLPDSGVFHDAWRREQAIKAAGVRISEAQQKHYPDLEVHFLALANQPARAFNRALRADTNPERIALFHLRKELESKNLPERYAEAICARRFRVHLAQATAAQVWKITFGLRNMKGPHA